MKICNVHNVSTRLNWGVGSRQVGRMAGVKCESFLN